MGDACDFCHYCTRERARIEKLRVAWQQAFLQSKGAGYALIERDPNPDPFHLKHTE